MAKAKKPKFASRARVRTIQPGIWEPCAGVGALDECPGEIRFQAKDRSRAQVICNVYERGVWKRVEHYHHECYIAAGEPYGSAAA